jgi:hypothetical protein
MGGFYTSQGSSRPANARAPAFVDPVDILTLTSATSTPSTAPHPLLRTTPFTHLQRRGGQEYLSSSRHDHGFDDSRRQRKR